MKKSLLMVMLLTGCASIQPTISRDDARTLGIGLHERQDRYQLRELVGVDPARIAWCAAYVDYVLETFHEVQGTGSLLAKSYLRWGIPVSEPDLWDVVVFERNGPGWEGHVGFYMGQTKVNGKVYYWILGGNQNDAVTIELYPESEVLGIRRAHYYEII
jgi:uncharacterized protein (TIGR02594 family)